LLVAGLGAVADGRDGLVGGELELGGDDLAREGELEGDEEFELEDGVALVDGAEVEPAAQVVDVAFEHLALDQLPVGALLGGGLEAGEGPDGGGAVEDGHLQVDVALAILLADDLALLEARDVGGVLAVLGHHLANDRHGRVDEDGGTSGAEGGARHLDVVAFRGALLGEALGFRVVPLGQRGQRHQQGGEAQADGCGGEAAAGEERHGQSLSMMGAPGGVKRVSVLEAACRIRTSRRGPGVRAGKGWGGIFCSRPVRRV
jgi:hypothetical protein